MKTSGKNDGTRILVSFVLLLATGCGGARPVTTGPSHTDPALTRDDPGSDVMPPTGEARRLSDVVTIAIVTPDIAVEVDGLSVSPTGDSARKKLDVMRGELETELQILVAKKGYRVVVAPGTSELQSAFETAVYDRVRTSGWRLPASSFESLAGETGADALLVSRLDVDELSEHEKRMNTICLVASLPFCLLVRSGPIVPNHVYPPELSIALVETQTGHIVWIGSDHANWYRGIRGMASRIVRQLPTRGGSSPPPVVGTPTAWRPLADAVDPASLPDIGANVVVDRTDGRTYVGAIVAKSAESVTLESDDDRRVELPIREISRISAFR